MLLAELLVPVLEEPRDELARLLATTNDEATEERTLERTTEEPTLVFAPTIP